MALDNIVYTPLRFDSSCNFQTGQFSSVNLSIAGNRLSADAMMINSSTNSSNGRVFTIQWNVLGP